MSIKTFYYKYVNVIGNPYRADGMTDLIGSAYKGVVNAVVYILFPVIRYLFKYHFANASLGISVIYFLNLKYQILAYGGGGAFSLTSGIMMFWIGMTIQKYEHIYKSRSPIYYLFPLLILLFFELPFLDW